MKKRLADAISALVVVGKRFSGGRGVPMWPCTHVLGLRKSISTGKKGRCHHMHAGESVSQLFWTGAHCTGGEDLLGGAEREIKRLTVLRCAQ